MIIYNVTINIEDSVHEEWLEWMKTIHIPEVMSTGLFSGNKILKVLGSFEKAGEISRDPDGTTYSIQYLCDSMKEYEHYHSAFAPALQAKHTEKYKGKFVAFRTLLEIIK